MSTNLEYRASERQGKRKSRRQASEAQREKGQLRYIVWDKAKETFFVGRTKWKFCSGDEKIRNPSGHQCMVKMSGSGKKKTKREHSSVSTEELFSLITEASSWIHSNYVPPNFPPLCGIEQSDSLTLLGVTLQNDCKFSSHVEGKLREANNCLYILRSLRKDGYTQVEIDHFFKAIVLPKITDALPVYGASQVDLNTIQCFLNRCNKRRYTSELINIYDLLEKCDRRLLTKN